MRAMQPDVLRTLGPRDLETITAAVAPMDARMLLLHYYRSNGMGVQAPKAG